MYLIGTATTRNRLAALVTQVRTTPDASKAEAQIADAIPERLADAAGPKVVEAIRGHLLKMPQPRAGLGGDDYRGASSVALLVVSATLPSVIPFMVLDRVSVALRVSSGVALVTLFVSGWIMGRYASGSPWLAGLTIVAIGSALLAAIIALGG
jgi:VIT1/CCC1 family predicted Fe2+/Mn2+ transporter